MPLSKTRNRERMRALRATCVQPTISGLEIKGNRILGCTKKPVQPVETAPAYNPNKQYSPGDRVLVKPLYGKKLAEVIIPEFDADGNPLPDYE